MKLVIAEKPSVAMSIAKVIGASEKKNGYIVGNGYIVSWCIGHLVTLANPEEYDEKYSKWKYEDLPILPVDYQFAIKKSTEKQFKILEKLIKSNDVDSIIEATDAGREGELIFRLVYDMTKTNKPFKRLWISSMEDTAIKEGFKELKDGDDYENLYQSALARSKADWLIGLNATRLFTTIYKNKLSVGRVQTPTLAMIAERDNKIKNFKKDKFYHVVLDLKEFKVKSGRFENLKDANELMKFCEGKKAIISDVDIAIKKQKPPLLFDLTTLQRESNRLFGYTAKQTLDYAQSLYEKKLITYPRTDSRYITEDMKENVINLILKLDVINPNVDRIINNKKVADHHAIILTTYAIEITEDKIPLNELNVLKLIKSKLIVAVGLDYVCEQIVVKVNVEDKEFKTTGKTEIELGFKKVENEFKKSLKIKEDKKEESIVNLPKLKKKDEYIIKTIEKTEGVTSPPKYFTEDTLLSAMERAGNEDLDESLETEKKGLGTSATRASIIEKLISVNYIERSKKNLLITEKGTKLIKVVPDKIKSAKLTAEWENKLTEISIGKRNSDEFIKDIESEVIELINSCANVESKDIFKIEKESIGNCVRCGSEVYEGNKNFYCSNKECKFSMWKEDKFFKNKKKTLTKTIAKKLLSKGKVKIKKLYSEKKDKYYEATIVLNDTGTWVNYKLEF